MDFCKLVWIWGSISAAVGATCLPEGIPDGSRINLTNAAGESFPLGVWTYNWDSGLIVQNIYEILASEILGYNIYKDPLSGGTSLTALYALGGCTAPAKFASPNCTSSSTRRHVALESWLDPSAHQTTIDEFNAAHPSTAVEMYGSVGYTGNQGLFVSASVMSEAMNKEGLPMEYYKSYNASWHQPHQYFEKNWHTTISPSELSPCSTASGLMKDNSTWYQYFLRTGDEQGITVSGGSYSARCADGYWWLSPACRNNISICVPLITGAPGYALDILTSRATRWGMPIALAVSSSYSTYVSLPAEHTTLFYWWTPDTTFISLGGILVQFPPADGTGNIELNLPSQNLYKMASRELSVLSPKARALLDSVTWSDLDISTMLQSLMSSGGSSHYDVGCAWLKENRAIWSKWIPSTTTCYPGFGLVDQNDSFVNLRSAAAKCRVCPSGMYSVSLLDSEGATFTCRRCPAGTSQSQSASTSCTICGAGLYSLKGADACTPCPHGSFQATPGQGICTVCPEGQTTFDISSTSSSQCGCPVGKVLLITASSMHCSPCPAGTTCGFGSAYDIANGTGNSGLQQSRGFWVQHVPGQQLSVFECHSNMLWCPAGDIGTCASGRGGLGCADCVGLTYAVDDGTCAACGRSDNGPLAGLISGAIMVLCLAYKAIDGEDKSKQSLTVLFIAAASSQLVTLVQTFGVLATFNLSLPEPAYTLLQGLKLLNFHLEVLRLGCVTSISPLNSYALEAFLVVVLVGIISVIHVFFVVVRHRGRFIARMPTLIATQGTVFITFFISTVSAMVTPFQCFTNPNGIQTLRKYPSVICWQDSAQLSMIGVAIGAMTIPLAFLACAIWALAVMPTKVRRGNVGFLKMVNFLVFRFRPEARWFALAFLVRGLLLALAPIIPEVSAQILAMQLVIVLSLLAVAEISPWRAWYANVLDKAILCAMQIVMMSVAFFADSPSPKVTSTICSVFIIACCVIIPFALICGIGRYFWLLAKKPFRFFICHHKAAAGSMARLMKLELEQHLQGRSSVFLDSDNLSDLDGLFDVVRSQTQTLIVIVTSELLRRPWCVGEIATACANSVHTIPVYYPSVPVPSEEFIEQCEVNEFSMLAHYGLDILAVKKGLSWFGSLEHWSLVQPANPTSMLVLSKQLMAAQPTASAEVKHKIIEPLKTRHARDTKIVILAQASSIEAAAAAQVLASYMSPQLAHDAKLVPVFLGSDDAFPESSQICVVVCTEGCFHDIDFLKLIMILHERGSPRVLFRWLLRFVPLLLIIFSFFIFMPWFFICSSSKVSRCNLCCNPSL